MNWETSTINELLTVFRQQRKQLLDSGSFHQGRSASLYLCLCPAITSSLVNSPSCLPSTGIPPNKYHYIDDLVVILPQNVWEYLYNRWIWPLRSSSQGVLVFVSQLGQCPRHNPFPGHLQGTQCLLRTGKDLYLVELPNLNQNELCQCTVPKQYCDPYVE